MSQPAAEQPLQPKPIMCPPSIETVPELLFVRTSHPLTNQPIHEFEIREVNNYSIMNRGSHWAPLFINYGSVSV
jgi:hypothetical protein